MAIYKQGCTDREMVKRIQKVVGCTPDGVWGPKTTVAVKAWQRAHKLTDDGVVGPATLAAMGLADNTQTVNDGISITNAFIKIHITASKKREIKYIAIHFTAGSTSKGGTALRTRNVFLQREASADFVVDDDTIVQVNPDIRNYYCWAVGDNKNPYTGGGSLNGKATNKNTVSIEICSTLRQGTSASVPNHNGWSFTDKALGNARRLVRYLMKEYGIPKENVIRHYDATGKLCPGIPGWNDGPLYDTSGRGTGRRSDSREWKRFWDSL